MEPRRLPSSDQADRDRRAAADDLRGLQRLRDRIEAAAHEIERLREENRELAGRLAALEGPAAPLAGFGRGEDAAALRRKIEGFVAAIDEVLHATPDGAAVAAGASPSEAEPPPEPPPTT